MLSVYYLMEDGNKYLIKYNDDKENFLQKAQHSLENNKHITIKVQDSFILLNTSKIVSITIQ